MDLLDRMLDYDCWAMNELFDLSDSLTAEQLDQHFDIGQQNVRATFAHMIFESLEFWTEMMLGNPKRPAFRNDLPRAELRSQFKQAHQEFAAFSRKARDENRMDEIFVDHFGVKKSVGSTILAVLDHSEVHRSEIIHMLTRLRVVDEADIDIGAWDYERLHT